MPKIAIVADDYTQRAQYLDNKQIPVKYMEDFTVLGFIVSEHEKACALLRQEGYTVHNHTIGAEVIINDASQIQDISTCFGKNDITSTFSDIADTLYQA